MGDYVFLSRGPNPGKFGDHYTGPHKILELINKNNVKIQFKENSKIVHANRLRISHINHEIKVKRKKLVDNFIPPEYLDSVIILSAVSK